MQRRYLRAIAGVGLALMALYLIVGYLTPRLRWISSQPAPVEAPPLPPPAHRVAGALHVHTQRSHDSEGSEEEVARAAQDAGLDFVVLSDHRSESAPDSLWAIPARYNEGVLIIRGQEISLGGDVGRVLTFGLDTALTGWDGGVEWFAKRLESSGATGIIAHPRSPRTRDSWRPGSMLGIVGWEAFDFADIGRTRLAGPWAVYHLLSLAVSVPLGRTDQSLLRLYREGFHQPAVAAFDSLYASRPLRPPRPMTALAGLDVHPKARVAGGLIPGYGPFFRSLVNHIELSQPLAQDPRAAARALAEGLAAGRVFISFGNTSGARSFVWSALPPGGSDPRTDPLSVARWRPGFKLRAGFRGQLVKRLAYRVVRDGVTVVWIRGPELAWPVEAPGAYRVEVYQYSLRVGRLFWNLRPWIFSNPIRLRGNDVSGRGSQ